MAKRVKYNIYCKLTEDGLSDRNSLSQNDYDEVVKFISTTFSSNYKVQQDVDATLKRRFIFRAPEKKTSSFKRHRKQKKGPRSTSNLRCYNITPKSLPYKDFLPLHELWKSYVTDLLQRDTKVASIQFKLSRMDTHGARLLVTESKCESFVGIKGIVIQETKNTFVILTESDEVKRVPKADTTFEAFIPQPAGVVEIIGNNFISRPADRSSKKLKSFVEKMSARTHRKLIVARKKRLTGEVGPREN